MNTPLSNTSTSAVVASKAPARWLLDGHAPEARLRAEAGGKAWNLARMARLGLPVPPFICVSSAAFDEICRSADLPALDGIDGQGDLGAIAARLTDKVMNAPFPDAMRAELAEKLRTLRWQDRFLAVRSSGLDEDSARHSFAGQYASFLYQRGLPDLVHAIKACWASAFSQRLLSYRRERGLPAAGGLGVVIQPMVEAEVAGVAFSRDPVKVEDRTHLVISGAWGLGEALVNGSIDADHFHVDRQTRAVKVQLADKAQALRPRPDGGVHLVPVAKADRQRPCLDERQVQEVAEMTLHLERALGGPQDCEWAYEGGTLFLLQTRPITHLPPDAQFDPRTVGERPVLWDNSNIIESFCGVTTPLTFSHASRGYQAVYRQFCQLMGVRAEVIAGHEAMFRNMLGLVRGRIYYNLRNWYQLCALFPFASQSQSYMETMMGVKEELAPALAQELALPPARHSLWQKLRLLLVSIQRYARIDGLIARFEANLAGVWQRFGERDMDELALPEQMALYHHLEDQVLRRWQAPIVNDGRCMLAFGLLKALTAKWLGGTGISMNDLLCGQGDVESTEPTKRLMHIAAAVDRDGLLREWFLSTPPAEVAAALRAGTRGGEVSAMFRDYLARYGFRCVDELKLEQPDLHDDPSFAINAIASYLRLQSYDTAAMEGREKAIRAAAEETVARHLRGLRRRIYLRVLQAARHATRDRERLRFARTRAFGLVRRLFRAMGRKLAALGVLRDGSDVFYLTVEELSAYVEGRSVLLDLGALAELRRREFDGYRRSPAPPDRFVTTGAVGAMAAHPALLAAGELRGPARGDGDPNTLWGTPCCPGAVEGVVRVARSVEDAAGLKGEILVTERTDPGWVPLYPTCSGLLIERGSLLSHSAVVARELGLPTIVGISGGLMARLRSGDRVKMDGARGEVRLAP